MPTTFIKSIALTVLLILQVLLTDAAISYIKGTNLPIEIALVIGLAVLLLGIVLYRNSIARLIEKKPKEG